MLQFNSASVRIANTQRAVDECVEITFGDTVPEDCGVIMVNAAIGHKLDKVAAALKTHTTATILGTSCGGVVGREGAGEALTHLAIMGVCGPKQEYTTAAVDGIFGKTSYVKGLELARTLKARNDGISIIYLICPGLDINCDLVLQAFDEVFGPNVMIFGGTSADNYKAVTTFQYLGDDLTEHGAWAVGLADATLHGVARASHGFVAYGDPMVVDRAEGNRIDSLDGMDPFQAYTGRLSMIPEDDPNVSFLAAGALAKELPPELAEEYRSPHILRGLSKGEQEKSIYLSVTVKPGDRFWLTTRDESLIFSEQEKALEYLLEKLDGHKPVAVLQADCLARGRTLFNRVMKDELTGMMQTALSDEGEVPPWLGMYGFGEFCPLGGKNTFHTYTTSLLVLYR